MFSRSGKESVVLDHVSSAVREEIWSASLGAPSFQPWQPGKASAASDRLSARLRFGAVEAYVAENMHRKIYVSQLAKLSGLSRGYFSRAFISCSGKSPYAYVVACRLERALDLLRLTDKKLTEIAMECGFSDQAHFCRLFRRLVGCSPGECRRHPGRIDHGIIANEQ